MTGVVLGALLMLWLNCHAAGVQHQLNANIQQYQSLRDSDQASHLHSNSTVKCSSMCSDTETPDQAMVQVLAAVLQTQ